jgi:hypothetical protein
MYVVIFAVSAVVMSRKQDYDSRLGHLVQINTRQRGLSEQPQQHVSTRHQLHNDRKVTWKYTHTDNIHYVMKPQKRMEVSSIH